MGGGGPTELEKGGGPAGTKATGTGCTMTGATNGGPGGKTGEGSQQGARGTTGG